LTPSENQNKISAVIPFYNEEKHLTYISNKVIKYVDILILVDDGSNDFSRSKIPINEKIILLTHPKNLGKGAALLTGMLKSIELKSDITITLDADNQHDPKFILKLIEKLDENECVIGSRNKDKSSMPIHRKLSNYLTSKILSLKTGKEIIDSQSGFRAFKTNILKDILPKYSGFEAESEMIVKLSKKNYSIGFVEIPTIYGDDDSKMRAIPTILGFIKVILKV